MKFIKRFLYITEGLSWRKKFYVLSYAYLPYWLFDIIWKGYEE